MQTQQVQIQEIGLNLHLALWRWDTDVTRVVKCHLVTKFSSKKPQSIIISLHISSKRLLEAGGSSLMLAAAVLLNKVSAALVHSDEVSNGNARVGNHDICSRLNANIDANPVPSMLTPSLKLN